MLGYYNYTVILTYLSLVSGVTGIFLSFENHPYLSAVCLLFCGLFDAFDGMIARTRKKSTTSEKKFGIQIDSLSDLICFGVLPCCVCYSGALKSPVYIPLFCIYVLAALIRLAYFNVNEEERQQQTAEKRKEYQGLPVTTASLIVPFVFFMAKLFFKPAENYILLALLLILAILFVAGKIRVKKPGLRTILFMVALGVVELTVFILIKTGILHI